MTKGHEHYYVPASSKWPMVGSIGLFFFAIGAATFIQGLAYGPYVFALGIGIILYMVYGWFSNVIQESTKGLYSRQMDRSFRWGMGWFIFSEVMFFAIFFGTLFYARNFSVPWLGGASNNAATNAILWKGFVSDWPLLINPDNTKFVGPQSAMLAWDWATREILPTINTLILVTSSFTLTFAHHALRDNKRQALNVLMAVTILLGVIFLVFQGVEYYEGYVHKGLKLSSGIYGTTFYMLTGFHGLHVTLGTIMLIVMFVRCMKGHFAPKKHFAFEAAAWYWHFVDVVWLLLYVYVYIMPLK